MAKLGRIAAALVASVIANAIGFQVLLYNQQHGAYSPDADTILIPIVENAAFSIVLLILIAISIVCGRRRTAAITWLGIALGVLATLLAGLIALRWLVPNHYSISLAFGALAAISAALVYFSFRRLASNCTPHTDARTSGSFDQPPSARAGERGR